MTRNTEHRARSRSWRGAPAGPAAIPCAWPPATLSPASCWRVRPPRLSASAGSRLPTRAPCTAGTCLWPARYLLEEGDQVRRLKGDPEQGHRLEKGPSHLSWCPPGPGTDNSHHITEPREKRCCVSWSVWGFRPSGSPTTKAAPISTPVCTRAGARWSQPPPLRTRVRAEGTEQAGKAWHHTGAPTLVCKLPQRCMCGIGQLGHCPSWCQASCSTDNSIPTPALRANHSHRALPVTAKVRRVLRRPSSRALHPPLFTL